MLALKILGWVLLGLLALVVLLLVVPVRLRIKYKNELAATLWVLCVPIRLAPQKAKPDEEQADKPEKKKKSAKAEKAQKPKKEKKDVLSLKQHAKELKENGVAAAVEWLKEVARRVLEAADRLLAAVTVTHLLARVDIAEEDAANTALTYGKICGAAYPALGLIESQVTVKKQDVQIAPAFCLDKTRFWFDVRLKVSVWRIVVAALILLVQYIKMPTVGELKRQQNENNLDKEAV